jgi:LysR family transcriptional regulator, glycine cleavage system transcriptional activator
MRTRLAKATFPGSAALRTFESAGRNLSFKRAAFELKVTESAVSHQIRHLERELGAALFHRDHRQVKLTPAGRTYLAIVQKAHRDLLNATMSLDGLAKTQVRISLVPALAEHWLMPRLGKMIDRHPSISISIFASSDLVDLDRDEIDIAIRYGTGTWPRCRVQHLMDETAFPVAHPVIARKLSRRKIDDASDIPLLQNLQHPGEWGPWLPDLTRRRGSAGIIRLETSALVLRAATECLGIAIGRRPLVDDMLETRKLVRLSPSEVTTGKGYFILTQIGRAGERPAVLACVAALRELVTP